MNTGGLASAGRAPITLSPWPLATIYTRSSLGAGPAGIVGSATLHGPAISRQLAS